MRYLSVFSEDKAVLQAISDVFLKGKWFDLDCTYSKGIFYKDIKQPRMKSDLVPLFDDVLSMDSTKLELLSDESIENIVFDPPFLFRDRKSINADKMCERFSYFKTYDELLKMYKESLDCFHKRLISKGFVFFKCQDMTDGKFYCTHNDIIQYATKNGFELKDIIIKATNKKLQRDAVQQNCVAKVHSYWLVLKKKT
jgi:hypothetical protein